MFRVRIFVSNQTDKTVFGIKRVCVCVCVCFFYAIRAAGGW